MKYPIIAQRPKNINDLDVWLTNLLYKYFRENFSLLILCNY